MSIPLSKLSARLLFVACAVPQAASALCSADNVLIPGPRSELEGNMTVSAGSGCSFGVNGIPGAIKDVRITQAPRFGRAGVENFSPYYVAKPGYRGPDEFSYAFIGTDQYGGPMNVVVRRKVTVVP